MKRCMKPFSCISLCCIFLLSSIYIAEAEVITLTGDTFNDKVNKTYFYCFYVARALQKYCYNRIGFCKNILLLEDSICTLWIFLKSLSIIDFSLLFFRSEISFTLYKITRVYTICNMYVVLTFCVIVALIMLLLCHLR